MTRWIQIRRAYEPPRRGDGYRVLVDRVWPRGVSRDDLRIDAWLPEIAPSTRLRQWFGHDPERWEEFRKRYAAELAGAEDAARELVERARRGRLTLVYGARDPEHNNAVALRAYLEDRAAASPRALSSRKKAGAAAPRRSGAGRR
jgi:uncharacterized protein YeaO (DUF488 family)